MSETKGAFEPIIHDVKSTCSNLRTAADLLREVPPKEAEELLAAMVQQAEGLARAISDFKQERGQGK